MSYRPISLLPVLSKLFEKFFITKLSILDQKRIIPDHQFGFRQKHATNEQAHCMTNEINKALESNKYCTAAFLDIRQAFDKVWHTVLLYKIRKIFPDNIYIILKSHLENRFFLIKKCREEHTSLHLVLSGGPQGSVLGPLLYLLYTADLPTTADSITATFTDNTAILATHEDPAIATQRLQTNLNKIQLWLKKWCMKAN